MVNELSLLIDNNIKTKLNFYKSSKVKLFNPLPLIIVSSKYIDCYLGFGNVIILKNPKIY